MCKRSLFAVAIMLAGVSSANAAILQVGEFTGDLFEGFEAIAPPGAIPGPVDIFGGAATFNDSVAGIYMSAISLTSFLTGDTILPHSGAYMAGSVTGWATFEFDTPVTDFGGFIGTTDVLTGSSVSFYDATGGLLGTESIVIDHPIWAWHGWHSDTPIGRIEIAADLVPGKPLVFDDMQLSIPEPGALGLLAVGAAMLLRRR